MLFRTPTQLVEITLNQFVFCPNGVIKELAKLANAHCHKACLEEMH